MIIYKMDIIIPDRNRCIDDRVESIIARFLKNQLLISSAFRVTIIQQQTYVAANNLNKKDWFSGHVRQKED